MGEVGADSEKTEKGRVRDFVFQNFSILKCPEGIPVYFAKSNICFPDPPDKKLQGNLFLLKLINLLGQFIFF